MSDLHSLQLELKKLEETEQSHFAEIGKKCYLEIKNQIPESATSAVTEIENLESKKLQTQRKIWKLKGIFVCPACGAEIPDNSKFCNQCGVKLSEEFLAEEMFETKELEIDNEDIFIPEEELVAELVKPEEEPEEEAVEDLVIPEEELEKEYYGASKEEQEDEFEETPISVSDLDAGLNDSLNDILGNSKPLITSCPKCGKAIKDPEQLFCTACGFRL